MELTCRLCSGKFSLLAEELAFRSAGGPTLGRKGFEIPPPNLCPDCRFKRRVAFRNERRLYHRRSDLSGKQIISMFSPNSPYKVFDQAEWWSDGWDALTYGQEIDFEKTFTEQFALLSHRVPHNSLFTVNCENSYYANYAINLKNSYLIFGGANDEDCLYGRFISNSKDVVDGLHLYSCELCYECIAAERCYACCYSMNCRDCRECFFVEDCESCSNCFLCFGLERKQFYIANEYVGKARYEAMLREQLPLSAARVHDCLVRLAQLKAELPHRQWHVFGCEECSGDMISFSKNCHYAFDVTGCEDARYIWFTPKTISSYDATYASPDGVQFCYETCSTVGVSSSMSTFLCWYGDSIFYSMECYSCSNIFGCVGLRNKEYCIFNKQYSREDYEEKVSRLIALMRRTGEWGEYFHPSLSLFGYNQTVAFEYFPLNKAEAVREGWKWLDDQDETNEENAIHPLVPDVKIEHVDESICRQTFRSEKSGRAFRIIPQELRFYRKLSLPLPRISPDERHYNRLHRRTPRRLFPRNCAKTGARILTTYPPHDPVKVYSEAAFVEART